MPRKLSLEDIELMIAWMQSTTASRFDQLGSSGVTHLANLRITDHATLPVNADGELLHLEFESGFYQIKLDGNLFQYRTGGGESISLTQAIGRFGYDEVARLVTTRAGELCIYMVTNQIPFRLAA